jgi:molybdopterin-biosynthesis enzyme MoeA-like protein|tara:strand:+ start:7226 stop:7957 length:732 start_codon:yes stop_codon:yes gene_type:complete
MKKKIHGIIVGDEILSGKRQDKHLHYLAKTLNSKGLSLNKVDYVSDDLRDISETIQKKLNCIVFCFGGIGATPDDCTRQAAAKAHQRKLAQHPEALQLIIDQFGVDAYPKRVLMSEIPVGANIIPNEINNIPGFSVGEHYFMPGFPEMSWPMVQWVLEKYYSNITKDQLIDLSIWIDDVPESKLINLMNNVKNDNPEVKIYSLPKLKPKITIELGVKGDNDHVYSAMEQIKQGLVDLNYQWNV